MRLLCLTAALCLAVSANAAPNKVDVCHYTGNGSSHIINVSQNAVPAHVAHGDHVVGAEVCDGIDNDCNGVADDNIAPIPSDCGIGSCAATGAINCIDGVEIDDCTPGAPSAETCNGADDDCDGSTDDGIDTIPTTCGTGACASQGGITCFQGALVDTCSPGAPSAEACGNAADDDCDGQIDENCAPICARILLHCNAGSSVLTTICGAGLHTLTSHQANNISYVKLNGSASGAILHKCRNNSSSGPSSIQIFSDTNLCSLPGGCCSDPLRFNDNVCSIELF